MRKGFTLPEIMVATAISAVVLVAVCNFFIGAQRMMKLTLAQSELALQSRALRDKRGVQKQCRNRPHHS